MNINNFNNTTFGATLINNVRIQKLDADTGSYKTQRASFVKFDPKNRRDLSAIKGATKGWDGDFFGRYVALRAEQIAKKYLSPHINHVYLLTSQLDNFDKLDKNAILGIAEMQTADAEENVLSFLQVKPESTFIKGKRPYKKVGARILSSLKKIYKEKITLISTTIATKFYENQGFVMLNEEMLKYGWKMGKRKV